MRKDFEDCLELIESPLIRGFVRTALFRAPKEFWTAPCSSSGKYHPPEDQVEGGIIVHTRKAIQVALSFFRFFEIKDQLVKDKIIAACILHDICKNGIPWGERTDYKHGLIAFDWLTSIFDVKAPPNYARPIKPIVINRDIVDIAELVRDHMGIWSKPEPTPALKAGKEITEKTIWHTIIQIADYWASRKWCPFVCDEFVA